MVGCGSVDSSEDRGELYQDPVNSESADWADHNRHRPLEDPCDGAVDVSCSHVQDT